MCESLAGPQARKRETAAVREAMAEQDLKTGTIDVVPAWRFLLELPEAAE